jgi:hypothetical protein
MMENGKRSLLMFIALAVANISLYVASYLNHIALARLAAFVALFLSMFTFVQSYRSGATAQIIKLQAQVSIWATTIAGGLYLFLKVWRP